MGAVVFFAFILFVMGGVTAYMGDRLGSYIGKKRHSTFGLRPRHTAMLWTVVSGGIIAVGTLGLFLVLNRTFSTALVRGPQLLEMNSMLDRQNRTLTRRNLATEQQAQADNARAGQAQEQLKNAQGQAEAAQARATQAQKALTDIRSVLGQAQSTLAQSRRTLAQRQAALTSAKERLIATRDSLSSTHEELTRAQRQVRAARLGVRDAQKQFQLASSQVVRANKNVLALGIKQDQLHDESLIFHHAEELGRTVVSAGQPPASLRRELAVFLDQVELVARQRGAGGLDNSPAVVVAPPGGGGDSGAQAREAALDALSESIAAQGGDQPSVVVVADARYNTFKGEAVKLDLTPYANVMIFPKGTVIAAGTLDGGQPDDVILKNLQTFLTGQVRTVALERGIIPVHDPQSGEALVGQPIDTPTSLALVKQIQQAGPDAHITAAAAADTYSADLLRLDLRVTPAPTPPRVSAARQ